MSQRITDDPEFNMLIRPIRSKTLQRLLLVWYNIFYDYRNSPVAAKIMEREREKEPNLSFKLRTIAWSLRPKDVAEMLKISERQAREYVKFFRIIYTGTQE